MMTMVSSATITEQNRAIAEAMYKAGIAQDYEGFMAGLADDLVINEPDFLPYRGIFYKKDFLSLMEKINRFMDLSNITLHYLIADGDRVAACLGIPDQSTGELTHFLEQCTFRDGKVVDIKLFYYNPCTMMTQPKLDER
jgi:ketosteroid isomerase-like protein